MSEKAQKRANTIEIDGKRVRSVSTAYTHTQRKKNDERRKGKIINWLWLLCKLERGLNHRMGSGGGGGGRVSLCALLYDGALSGKLLWLMSNGKAK